MFAGPNGSGKSTIKRILPKELLGVYINPDEIQKEIEQTGHFDLAPHGTTATTHDFQAFIRQSTLFTDRPEAFELLEKVVVTDGKDRLRGGSG